MGFERNRARGSERVGTERKKKICIEFVYEIEMFSLHHVPYFIPSQL